MRAGAFTRRGGGGGADPRFANSKPQIRFGKAKGKKAPADLAIPSKPPPGLPGAMPHSKARDLARPADCELTAGPDGSN